MTKLAVGQDKNLVSAKLREVCDDFSGVDCAPPFSGIYSAAEYQPGFCEVVVCAMSQGLDRKGAAGAIGCDFETFEKWEAEHPAFAKAVAIGESKAQYFWQKQSIKHLVFSPTGKQINSKVLALNMQARYGWGEPKEETKQRMRVLAFELDKAPKYEKDDE